MIHQLPTSKHERARPLFAALEDHLAVNAILEGSARGRVYVDNPARPTAALAWTGHRLHLAGDPQQDAFNEGVRRLFAEAIYPQGLAAGALMFTLYHAPAWEEAIERILEGRFPMRDERVYLEMTARTPDRSPQTCQVSGRVPPGFSLRAVDRDLLADAGLGNLEALKEEMCSERESVDVFLARSSGVCLLCGDEIVAWCLSEYNSAERCEVGIETVERYRRQGLATAAATALAEEACARGVRRIGWHAWASNLASIATARRAGFAEVRRYPIFFAWYDEVDNLAVNGNLRYRAGDYRAAVEWYGRAFRQGEARAWAYWSAGCAYALLGEEEAALGALRQAVARGFCDAARLQSAPELASLHGTQGWRIFMQELA